MLVYVNLNMIEAYSLGNVKNKRKISYSFEILKRLIKSENLNSKTYKYPEIHA